MRKLEKEATVRMLLSAEICSTENYKDIQNDLH